MIWPIIPSEIYTLVQIIGIPLIFYFEGGSKTGQNAQRSEIVQKIYTHKKEIITCSVLLFLFYKIKSDMINCEKRLNSLDSILDLNFDLKKYDISPIHRNELRLQFLNNISELFIHSTNLDEKILDCKKIIEEDIEFLEYYIFLYKFVSGLKLTAFIPVSYSNFNKAKTKLVKLKFALNLLNPQI